MQVNKRLTKIKDKKGENPRIFKLEDVEWRDNNFSLPGKEQSIKRRNVLIMHKKVV